MSSIPPDARQKLEAYLRFQQELGIERLRIAPFAPEADDGGGASRSTASPDPGPRAAGPAPSAPLETLAAIQADLGPDCRRCKLHRLGRHKVVFGDGNPEAELVFVGEAPGADEDAQGLPFVGRGGQLLNDMIQKGMGLRREQVYICNVVKCRPPGNRTPEADECATCSPFLMRQLAAIRPRIICALGATAAQALRPFKGPLGSVRGRRHSLRIGDAATGFDTQLVITYHPAYLLRDPSQKKEAWKDLQLIMSFLGLKR